MFQCALKCDSFFVFVAKRIRFSMAEKVVCLVDSINGSNLNFVHGTIRDYLAFFLSIVLFRSVAIFFSPAQTTKFSQNQ